MLDSWDFSPLPRFGELTATLGSDYLWYVSEPFQIEVEEGSFITIRPGFRTDFASVPVGIRLLVRHWTRTQRPALLHDYYYRMGGCTRKWADKRFLDALEVEGVDWLTRRSFWLAVRSCGWLAWRRR